MSRGSLVTQRVRTGKHQKHLKLQEKGETVGQNLLPSVVKRPEFVTDLARMMVSSNIPLYKVEQPAFLDFIEKYTGKSMPSRMTLSRCMEEQSKNYLQKVKLK